MAWKRPKHLGLIITGVIVVGLIIFALLPSAVDVEIATVERTMLRSTVDAEGRVRYKHRYVMSMPVHATIARIDREPGDIVRAGEVLGRYTPPLLDPRQRSEATARASAAAEALREARARVAALIPLVEQAKRKRDRLQRLHAQGAVPKDQMEMAQDAAAQLEQELFAGQARVEMVQYEVQAARAATAAPAGSSVPIVAPIDGVILRRFEEQERLLPAGSPVLEIGSSDAVEIVADVLSVDAVRIQPGMRAMIEGWGGEAILKATVRRVEPAARTTFSSLGIEEKRVDVVMALDASDKRLGDGYKVDARIVLWEDPQVLAVPLSALVKNGKGWGVFVVADETAVLRTVRIGRRGSLTAQVMDGLRAGEQVVLHPPDALSDGGMVNVVGGR